MKEEYIGTILFVAFFCIIFFFLAVMDFGTFAALDSSYLSSNKHLTVFHGTGHKVLTSNAS